MRVRYIAALAALISLAGCAAQSDRSHVAANTPSGEQASIPFGRSQIYSWQVANDRSIYIETNNRQWYKADLMGHCIDLPFAQHVGFGFNADGSFDRFSTIYSRGQNCPVTSLTQVDMPPSGKKHIQAGSKA
jgi:hypothetical protein